MVESKDSSPPHTDELDGLGVAAVRAGVEGPPEVVDLPGDLPADVGRDPQRGHLRLIAVVQTGVGRLRTEGVDVLLRDRRARVHEHPVFYRFDTRLCGKVVVEGGPIHVGGVEVGVQVVVQEPADTCRLAADLNPWHDAQDEVRLLVGAQIDVVGQRAGRAQRRNHVERTPWLVVLAGGDIADAESRAADAMG